MSSRPGGALALDAYLPAGPGPHPAVLVIPGGEWMYIDKAKNDWLPIAARGARDRRVRDRLSTVDRRALPGRARGRAGGGSVRPRARGALPYRPGTIRSGRRIAGRSPRGPPRHMGRGIDRRPGLACGSRSPGPDRWTCAPLLRQPERRTSSTPWRRSSAARAGAACAEQARCASPIIARRSERRRRLPREQPSTRSSRSRRPRRWRPRSQRSDVPHELRAAQRRVTA